VDHFLKHLKDVVNNISSQLQPVFPRVKIGKILLLGKKAVCS